MKFVLFIIFLFSLNALALESTDKLKVNVIKAYDNNFLVINRGLEDGIYKSDHIKLTSQNGYIARAICIKASMLISHWKVYRVVHPELLSYDDTYKLVPMNQSEIPPDLIAFRTANFYDQFNDISDADINKPINMQQARIARFDLPPDVRKDPILLEANKTESDKFMEKNFDADQFYRDFSNLNISVYTSPISWQRANDQKSINYGLSVGNYGKKYELSFNLNKSESKVVDQYSGTEVSSASTSASVIFDINHITDDFTYFMFASYNQARTGETYYPRSQVQGGLLGLKYHIIQNDPVISKFDVSYITLMDSIEYDKTDYDDFGNPVTTLEKQRNARHSFRVRLKANLGERTTLNSVLWYKPYMYLKDQRIDWEDTMTNWTTNLSWSLTQSLSFSYQFVYTYDITQYRNYGVDPMNQINTINIQYSFEL